MIEFIKSFLASNQFASGGFLIMILGSIGATLYKLVPLSFNFLKRKFVITLDIPSYDDSFLWFNRWLATIDYSKKAKLLTVSSRYSKSPVEGELKPQLFFSPAPGLHVFFYKKHLVWINRSREKINNNNQGSFCLYESFVVMMLGRNKQILIKMLEEARDYNYYLDTNKVRIYINNEYNWLQVDSQYPRKIETVICKNDMQYDILNDASEFLQKEKWYTELGIPYRRGYLLYGSPGTGKTSLVKALAGELKLPIYILNISKDLKEGAFQKLLTEIPPKSIILIEDIDALYKQRASVNKDQGVSFKTLLNGIDGIISPNGTLLFLTTNHKENLDKALIRPGRIDKRYYLDKVNKQQTEKLFKLFYPKSNGSGKRFAQNIESNKFTPADLQQYFIQYKTDKEALKNINRLGKK